MAADVVGMTFNRDHHRYSVDGKERGEIEISSAGMMDVGAASFIMAKIESLTSLFGSEMRVILLEATHILATFQEEGKCHIKVASTAGDFDMDVDLEKLPEAERKYFWELRDKEGTIKAAEFFQEHKPFNDAIIAITLKRDER